MTPSEHLNDLLESGMDTAQAETVAMAIKASHGDLATQVDIDNLRAEWKINFFWLKWGVGITVALVVMPLIYQLLTKFTFLRWGLGLID